MEIFKDPLRPGLSYPIKPSTLIAALEAGGVRTPATLYQRTETWWTEGVLFRADFYPPGLRYLNETEVLSLTCRSVPSPRRQAAMKFVHEEVVPAMVAWITGLERLPYNSTVRREKQSFTRIWSAPASKLQSVPTGT